MTEKLTAYTPLETLLLFQSLASNGVEPSALSRTSDFLKNNPFIRTAKAYDTGRLSPDALRELYLSLLKEEVRAELDEASTPEGQESNGIVENASRKRKRSPSLLSAQEASKHTHLVPQLIARLYARYREHVIRDIREDERRHDALSQEIGDIQEGKWDERLMRQDGGQTRASSHTPSRASPSPVVPHSDLKPASDRPEAESSTLHSIKPATAATAVLEPRPVPDQPNLTAAKIDSVINHPLTAPQSDGATSITPGPRVILPSQESPTQSDHPTQQITPGARLPLPRPSNSGYRLHSPSIHQSPYAPSPPPPVPGAAISPSPKPIVAATDGRSPSSSSPVVLPPPPGMQYVPPPSNAPPYPAPTPYSPQRYGQPSPKYAAPSPVPNENQPSRSYAVNQYPQYPNRPLMPASQPPIPSHSGGVMLPPFQLDLQNHGRPSTQQQISPSTATVTPTRTLPPVPSRDVPQRVGQSPSQSGPTPKQIKEIEHIAEMLVPKLATPATKWRKVPPELAIPRSPTRPPIETLSPIKQRPASLDTEVNETRSRRQRKRDRTDGSAVEDIASVEGHSSETGAAPKFRQARNRKTRGASVSSSAMASSVRGRTRSQSVTSRAESSAQDNEPASQRSVKHEPPSTPAGSTALSDIAGSETTPTDARVRRRRGATLPSAPETAQKRKRPAREASESFPSTEIASSGSDRQYITASRNFQRTSLTIMNDITSHKYASYFAQPVTDRQAEGYHDIIYRSQDLRTIRGLITAGSKLIGSMASSASSSAAPDGTAATPLASPGGPASAPTSSTGTIVLPAHPSIMPPHAIINSAQLEKEIMRMLANAVMFNPGEEGLVADARAMADDVQGMVRAWRGAERTLTGTPVPGVSRGKVEDEEGEGSGGGEQEEGGGKRRKL
ncbi:MAG: hypothetical protein M1821_003590 [Bathelium mastoideum]|nr:MAG: hypothetical protein M1821_003590 [Bathelium mastoideum]